MVRYSVFVFALALASACISAEPPSAKDILDSVRMLESRQQIDLQGQLRQEDTVIPFRLMQNGPLIRYTFTIPDETLQLRLGESSSRLDLESDAGTEKVGTSKLQEKIRGTIVTYGDLAFKFLYWPTARVLGEENVRTRKCWKLQLRAPSRESLYSNVLLWVDKKAAALKAQQDKVAESASKGHGTRLEQRRRTVLTLEQACKEAKATQAKCSEQAATLGPAGQRADRDFRKQTIMTIRTLVLENWLRAFMGALAATLYTKVSLPQVLSLLFERSGSRMETPSQVLYWVNRAGLSLSNRRLLSEVAQGLCAMGLQEQGKPVHVRLKDLPP